MATKPISNRYVTVEEYLHTVYEPDCEYDDGDVLERNLGEFDHSYLQVILGTLFTVNMENWGVFGLPEQRVQINPLKFLVPDICVLSLSAPREQIITHPPLVAIEIMSPEDTLRKVAVKATIYLEFGVEHVWVIDPKTRQAYRGTASGLEQITNNLLAIPGTPIQIQVAELFSKLDRINNTTLQN